MRSPPARDRAGRKPTGAHRPAPRAGGRRKTAPSCRGHRWQAYSRRPRPTSIGAAAKQVMRRASDREEHFGSERSQGRRSRAGPERASGDLPKWRRAVFVCESSRLRRHVEYHDPEECASCMHFKKRVATATIQSLTPSSDLRRACIRRRAPPPSLPPSGWLRLGIRRRRAVRGSAIVGCRPIGDERPPAGSACAPVGRRSRAATLQGRRTVSGSSCSPATQQRTDWQGVEVWSGGMRACEAALGSLGCPNGRCARASRLGGAGSRGDPRLQAGGQRAGDGWPDLCSFWTSARASKVQCDRPA